MECGLLGELGVWGIDLLAVAALQLVGLVGRGLELAVEMQQVLALQMLAVLPADWQFDHPLCLRMQHTHLHLLPLLTLLVPPPLDEVSAALHVRVILLDPLLALGPGHDHHVEGHGRLEDRLQLQLDPLPHLQLLELG